LVGSIWGRKWPVIKMRRGMENAPNTVTATFIGSEYHMLKFPMGNMVVNREKKRNFNIYSHRYTAIKIK
jgi:hypothetical protein